MSRPREGGGRGGGDAAERPGSSATASAFLEFLASEFAAMQGRLAAELERAMLSEGGAAAGEEPRGEINESPCVPEEFGLSPEPQSPVLRESPAGTRGFSRQVSVASTQSAVSEDAADSGEPRWLASWGAMAWGLLAKSDDGGRMGNVDSVGEFVLAFSDPCDDQQELVPHDRWATRRNTHRFTRSLGAVMPRSTSRRWCMSSESLTSLSSRGSIDEYTYTGAGFVAEYLVIHPNNRLKFMWILVGVALLIYDLFSIPLEAVDLWRATPDSFFALNLCYWIVDVFVQTISGYAVDNHVEMRPAKLVRRYATSWLALDVAVILVDAAFLLVRFNSGARFVRLIRLVRLVRVFRFRAFAVAVRSRLQYNVSQFLVLFFKILWLMSALMISVHYIACMWVGLAHAEEVRALWGWGLGGSWLRGVEMPEHTELHTYVLALSWTLTQFTPATNNIAPISTLERIFSIGVVLAGMLSFSAFLSSMTSTVNQLKSLNSTRVRERHQLIHFIRFKNITPKVGGKAIEFFDTNRRSTSSHMIESDVSFFSQLPESMRISMRTEYFLPLLTGNVVINGIYHVDPRCFLRICYYSMSDHRYTSKDDVFVDGFETKCVYILATGSFNYVQGFRTTCLEIGEWLAEAAVWVNDWVTQGSLVAVSCSTAVKLDCNSLGRCVKESASELYNCMRVCAMIFAHQLNLALDELGYSLTDRIPPMDDRDMIPLKALKFNHLPYEHLDRSNLSATKSQGS